MRFDLGPRTSGVSAFVALEMGYCNSLHDVVLRKTKHCTQHLQQEQILWGLQNHDMALGVIGYALELQGDSGC